MPPYLRHPLLVSIAGAIVAGLLALVPFAYQHVLQQRDVLIFKTTASPIIKATDGDKLIYVLSVENASKRLVEDIFISINIRNATISEVSHDYTAGASSDFEISNSLYNQKIASLNPGETFSISFLLEQVQQPLIDPATSIRAKGVPAAHIVEQFDNQEPFLLSAGPAVASMMFVYFLVFALVGRKLVRRPNSRMVTLNYILCATALHDALPFKVQSSTTYHMTADALYFEAQTHPDRRHACIAALACLLIIGSLAVESRGIVERHLKKLLNQGDYDELIKVAKDHQSDADSMDVRDRIELIVQRFSHPNVIAQADAA